MSEEKPETWPLLPAHSAYTLQGLCIALADAVREQAGENSRSGLIKLSGLSIASEVFANELAHFFASRPPKDHELLEGIEDRYLGSHGEASTRKP